MLFVGVRNRFCVICARALRKKIKAKEHACCLNWTRSSTEMEADIIVEGFSLSIEMHGLKYNIHIGRYIINVCVCLSPACNCSSTPVPLSV